VALAVSTAVVLGAIWLVRLPIAEFLIGAALSERGIDADFKVVSLDFESATVRDIRVGPAGAPDFAVQSAQVRWSWNGIVPTLTAVELAQPKLNLNLDGQGHVSAGALDHVKSGGGASRPALPQILLRIEDGVVRVHAPFGDISANVQSDGTLGRDFSALARIQPINAVRGAYAISSGRGELTIMSRDGGVVFRLSADADALRWAHSDFSALALRAKGRAPLDLSHYNIEAAWRAGAAHTPMWRANITSGAATLQAEMRADSLSPKAWQTETHTNAVSLAFGGVTMQRARFDGRIDGADLRGHGRWSLASDTFAGFSLISLRPSADGDIDVDLNGAGALNANARISLQASRLGAEGARRIRQFLPDPGETPVGPTFAQARRALLAAGRRFDLALALEAHVDDAGAHVVANAPAGLHAASGVLMRLKPLRQDTPALTMQWPGAALHGAVELDISGGGAPNAALLLDSIDWAPDAPFDAQGTLSIANWRAQGASISTDELNVGVTINPHAGGRIDLKGPVRITGPIADGDVRDLAADLDIGVIWNSGWRVVSNQSCLPVRLGDLGAPALSLDTGRFTLCPLGSAFIAASASHRLSGGFRVQNLALDGHFSGPDGQPARISSASLTGQFHGTTGDAALRLHLNGASLASGADPLIQDVRGDIDFDDLSALTTPPHQHVRIGMINPGIKAQNGDVFFAFLPGRRVAIEQAQFDFASGKLTLTPATIALGADETRFQLNLRDVDATALAAALNIPGLAATGHIEGNFPLLLTRRSAYIENGILQSQGDGGTLSYLGHAGDGATGAARAAFDALRDFRYDTLRLTLNGDLPGGIVSQIQIAGHGSAAPAGPVSSVSVSGRETADGAPFDFQIDVTAPFPSLAPAPAAPDQPLAAPR
jgi:hypothetical protein